MGTPILQEAYVQYVGRHRSISDFTNDSPTCIPSDRQVNINSPGASGHGVHDKQTFLKTNALDVVMARLQSQLLSMISIIAIVVYCVVR